MENYIFLYYQKICDGSIIVGKLIRKMYERVIEGLQNKDFFYDPKKAKRCIAFIETFCRHHEGSLAPQKIKLELWQKAFLSVVFGIVDKDGNRQFREVVLIMGRKNGKTLLASAIASYCLYMDEEYGARCYFTAPKLEQANLCYDALYQMIQKEPVLSRKTKKRRTDLYIAESNSSAKPLTFSTKKSDGLNISVCVADEFSSWVGDAGLKFYEVLKSSQGSRRQPLLLSISTAGYVNDSIYDELMKRSTAYLLGNSQETRLAPFIYMIDDADKWNDINELQKANPNLNVSISVDYLLEEIRVAEGSLSKKSEFMVKYTNTKQNSSCAWFNATDIEANFSGSEFKIEDYARHYCVIGLDLSQTTDLCSACVLIEKEGKINVLSHFWLPSERIDEASARDGLPYKAFIQRGWLTPSGENFIDLADIERWLTDLVSVYKLYPLQLGYDRYSAQYLINNLKAFGFVVDDVYQGTNLTPVINTLDGMIRDRNKFDFFDNGLMKIHLLNSALKVDNETNKKRLIKINANAHIDGCAALLDAMCVREKWFSEIGHQLANDKR